MVGLTHHYLWHSEREGRKKTLTFVRMLIVLKRNEWTSTKNCRNLLGRAFGELIHPSVSTWQPLNTRYVVWKKPTHNSFKSWRINTKTKIGQKSLALDQQLKHLYVVLTTETTVEVEFIGSQFLLLRESRLTTCVKKLEYRLRIDFCKWVLIGKISFESAVLEYNVI